MNQSALKATAIKTLNRPLGNVPAWVEFVGILQEAALPSESVRREAINFNDLTN
jgi:hypothetical protein